MLLTNIHDERSTNVLYRFTHAVILVLSVGLIGFAQVSASYVGGFFNHPPKATTFDPSLPAPLVDEVPPQIDDGKSLIPWFCSGTLVGGFICAGVRALKTFGQASRYFGVAVGVGLLGGIYFVMGTNYFPNPKWYHAFAATGAIAALSWFLIELGTICGAGVMLAAKERGILGVRDQILLILTLGTVNNNPKQSVNSVNTGDTSPEPTPVKSQKPT